MAISIRIDSLLYVITPPFILCRQGKLPDYKATYQEMITSSGNQLSGDPSYHAKYARRFCYLCRFLGVSWLFWLINFAVFTSGFYLLLLMFGNNLQWDNPAIQTITFRQVVSGLAALLFLGALVYYGINYLSGHFDECCRLKPKENAGTDSPHLSPCK